MHGGEAVASTEHVAVALARWHERGETAADLAFWRQHLQDFQSPKAFALVVEALLKKQDYRAALADHLKAAEIDPTYAAAYNDLCHQVALHYGAAQRL